MSASISPLTSSPSTADSSNFSSPDSIPDSIPSSTTLYLGAPKNRKRGRGTHEVKVLQKRRKLVGRAKNAIQGRPKNDWTCSRRRKLVRLYLMTDLEVDEIVKVLRTDSFEPW